MQILEKLPTRYDAGAATVVSGQTTVTPTNAAWYGNAWGDDLFFLPAQPLVPPQRIEEVNEDGTLTLAEPWPGTSASDVDYEIRYVGMVERSTAQTRRYLEMLGQLSALGLQPNAFGAGADRDTYDDRPEGFLFLDIGDPWTLYVKLSSASADWSNGQTMEGAPGPQGDNVVWLAGAAVPGPGIGQNGDMYLRTNGSVYGPKTHGAWGGVVVSLIGPGGADGEDGADGISFVWRGSFSAGTAYVPNDVVENNGSSWIALQATTGNNPPTLPTTVNTWWQLTARRGTDGAGTVSGVGAGNGINVDASNPAIPVVEVETNLQTWNGIAPSANAQALVSAATYAAIRALLDLEAGTDFYSKTDADTAFQPKDSELTSIAALTTTTYGRALLTLANQGALMALLSLSTTNNAGIIEQATTGEVRSGLADRSIAPDVAQAAMDFVSGPADAATMTFDHAAGVNQTATATAARTITASNLKNGLPLTIIFTGNFAHTYDTASFDFTEIGGVPASVWAVYKLSGRVRGGKLRVSSVTEASA